MFFFITLAEVLSNIKTCEFYFGSIFVNAFLQAGGMFLEFENAL